METKQLAELQESRNELLSRVSNLKRDLQDWRFKLDNQVKSYRSELGDLRKTLNSEVSQLRNEFQVRSPPPLYPYPSPSRILIVRHVGVPITHIFRAESSRLRASRTGTRHDVAASRCACSPFPPA